MGRGKRHRAPERPAGSRSSRGGHHPQSSKARGRHRPRPATDQSSLKARRRALDALLAARPLALADGQALPSRLGQYALVDDERAVHLYDHGDALLEHLANERRAGNDRCEVFDLDSGRRLDPSVLVSLRLAFE